MLIRPPISAIVPTWNALRYLPACLAALQAQLGPDDELVLVDNASRDQAGAWARKYAPEVRVLHLPTNQGFAGGTAAGITIARNALLLLINDDALAEPGCVAALWQALAANPSAGMAAGILTFSRRPELVASAGIVFQRDGVAADWQLGAEVDLLPSNPLPIFGASGGLALIRRSLIDDVGNLEASFFNYLEDADLAWRAQLRGWECVLAPQARARHVYSASSRQGSPFKQRLLGRNRLRVIVRCLPTPLLRDCLPQIIAYDLLVLAYATLRRQPAIIAGRLEGLAELPRLQAQRRAIQLRRTASVAHLAHWLAPAPPPWQTLQMAQRLATLTRA